MAENVRAPGESGMRPPGWTAWDILILLLSIYALGAAFAETSYSLSPEISNLLEVLDVAVCWTFLIDFWVKLNRASNKAAYLRWGWIDLVSSIPNLDLFRWGRLLSVVRILRILRAVRSMKVLLEALFHQRGTGVFGAVSILAFLLIIFASIVILNVEVVPGANIKSASDALWWAISTITTVGYGDRYPVTDAGRVVGAMLMITGVAVYGTFTAYVAGRFLERENNRDRQLKQLTQEVRLLREKVEQFTAGSSKP
jgi:voltage-gated potassium channel